MWLLAGNVLWDRSVPLREMEWQEGQHHRDMTTEVETMMMELLAGGRGHKPRHVSSFETSDLYSF